MFSSLYLKGIAVLAVGLIIFFGYRYVVNLQESKAFWQSQAQSLQLVVQSKDAALKSLSEGVKRQQVMHKQLEERLSAARVKLDTVTKVFNNHDFGKLLSKKPGLIHKRMRAGTKRVFLEFEEASRSN